MSRSLDIAAASSAQFVYNGVVGSAVEIDCIVAHITGGAVKVKPRGK